MPEPTVREKYKLDYRKVVEASMVISLLFLLVLFQAFKRFEGGVDIKAEEQIIIEVDEVPLTEQIDRPPPPPRPTVPIPSEDDDIPEDLTIEETELDFDEEPPPAPPPPAEEEDIIFVAYDTAPEAIGGRAAILKNLRYPEIARRAGVEGTVFIHALIDRRGNVINTKVLKSLGNNGCDEAAADAIKKTKWKPALQRDKPVKVWVSIPVVFKLKEAR